MAASVEKKVRSNLGMVALYKLGGFFLEKRLPSENSASI
jgi:hypothetical protein